MHLPPLQCQGGGQAAKVVIDHQQRRGCGLLLGQPRQQVLVGSIKGQQGWLLGRRVTLQGQFGKLDRDI